MKVTRRRVRAKRARPHRRKGGGTPSPRKGAKESQRLHSYVSNRYGAKGFTKAGYIKARILRGIALDRTSGKPPMDVQKSAMEELRHRDLPKVTKRYLRAEDYGDNPDIRVRYGEAPQTSQQPWEQRYRTEKRKLAEELLK